MHIGMKAPMTLIMTPVEIIGKFTKPFALAIRLFANMTAGHIVVLAMISLIFTFQKWLIVPAPLGMAIGRHAAGTVRLIFAGVLFMLLTSVFIGQVRASHQLALLRTVGSRTSVRQSSLGPGVRWWAA